MRIVTLSCIGMSPWSDHNSGPCLPTYDTHSKSCHNCLALEVNSTKEVFHSKTLEILTSNFVLKSV